MTNPPVHNVAVLGLGTIGHSVAQMFAAAGCRVRCFDESAEARRSAIDRMRGNLEQMAEAEIVGRDEIDAILDRVMIASSENQAVVEAEFVSEAIAEDLSIKQELFARLETLIGSKTILASNTSTFPMTEISRDMRHPERAIVTHPFNPPHLVPVVEVVPGKRTSPETIETTIALLEAAGRVPIRLNQELPGFLVNRVQIAMIREVWDLLDRGVASAEDIDRAIRGSLGFRLAVAGPLEICDFGGLDVWARVYQNLAPEVRSDTELPGRIGELIDAGHFGPKTGRGIYEASPDTIDEKRSRRDRGLLSLIRLFYSSHAIGGGTAKPTI